MRTLQVVIALLLLLALLVIVGAEDLLAALAELEATYVVYLLLLAVVMIWASCLKWRLFIRASGGRVSMLRLMKLYTIGYFFNTFAPAYVGGDLARSVHLGQYLGSQRDALVATFLERFTGLLAMALLGCAFVLAGAQATAGLAAAILSVGIGALLGAYLCFSVSAARVAFRLGEVLCAMLLPERVTARALRLVRSLDEGMRYARGNPSLVLRALLLSLFFHLLAVLNTYVAARAVGWESAPLDGLFVVVPLVLIVSMAPITPSGLGIQEGAFLFLLQRLGSSEAQALGVGVVLRAKVLLLALLGWLLWTTMSRRKMTAVGEDTSTAHQAQSPTEGALRGGEETQELGAGERR